MYGQLKIHIPGTSTSGYLNQFGAYRTSFDGDLAHLIGLKGGGGIAWINGACKAQKYRMAYSGISSSYQNVPTYSWTVECITHEQGHLLGSQHTHDCAWNGNNTKIDGCGDEQAILQVHVPFLQSCRWWNDHELLPPLQVSVSILMLVLARSLQRE